MQRKRTSYAATSTTQVEHKNNAFRSQQSGIQGRTARQPLADITLDGRTWQPRLPPPPWAHGEKACPFPVISKRSFYVTLSSPTCLVGFGGVCLQTLYKERGAIVVCSPTLKARKRAVCARRFSRQPPDASTGARALKKHGTGCLWTLMDCYCCLLRLRYLYMYMVCCCAKTLW